MRGLNCILQGLIVLAIFTAASSADSADSREDIEAAASKPIVQGGAVFQAYCVLCHGERGDGRARAKKLYRNVSLTINPHPWEYYEKIIQGGGLAVGRSEYMPSWNNELSVEQVSNVVEYLTVIANPVKRGEVVFMTNCISCHGVKGNGKGRASVLFTPPPANLTLSDKNDEYKRMIITFGGKAMGRSEVMPIWDEQLTTQQIEDVVAYLRTIVAVVP